MLALISWRNVWRQRGRSLVVISSVVVGIWALIFMVGFMNGWTISYINGAIKNEVSHIQIHEPAFTRDYDISFNIPDGLKIADSIRSSNLVKAVTARSITNGMISSSRKALGVKIMGITPRDEAQVTFHDSLVVKGDYFQSIKRNPVVIGDKLADELNVDIRSKVVITFQDLDRNITAGAFRVVGIIQTNSPSINEGTAYVRRADLNRIMGTPDYVHEIAIFLESPENEDQVMASLTSNLVNLKVESWRKIAPVLELFMEMTDSFLWVFLGIIMIALAFGIINSMLMAVLERFKELGMLMAVGMNKTRIFLMVVFETIYLCAIGAPLGMLAGYITISQISKTGIDLSNYSEGLREFGYDSILIPFVDPFSYVQITIGVAITAILGALYPAFKAIRLNPVEALHKI